MRIKLIVVLFIIPILVSSQDNFEFIKGDSAKYMKTITEIIGYHQSGVYASHSTGPKNILEKFHIDKYDHNLNHTSSIKLDLKSNNNDVTMYQFSIMLKDKIAVFSQRDYNAQKKSKLYCHSIDLNTFKADKSKWQKFEAEAPGRDYDLYLCNRGSYSYTVSPDTSKILIYYRAKGRYNKPPVHKIYVLDENLNLCWSKMVNTEVKDRYYRVYKYLVDNKGDAYLFTEIQNEKKEVKHGMNPVKEYHFIKYSNKGSELLEHKTQDPDKYLKNVKPVFNESNNEVVVVGLYHTKGNESIGYYYFKFDHQLKLKKEIYSELKDQPGNFFSKLDSTSSELKKFKMIDVLANKNGVYVLAQHREHVGTRYEHEEFNGETKTREIREYSYKNIMILNLDEQGEVKWINGIVKDKIMYSDKFTYFINLLSDDGLYFFFNDDLEDLPTYNLNQNLSKSGPVYEKIDNTGKHTKDILIKDLSPETFIDIQLHKTITRKSLFFLTRRDRMFTYNLLKLIE